MQGLLMNQEMAIKKMESNLFIRWVKLLEQAVVRAEQGAPLCGRDSIGAIGFVHYGGCDRALRV